MASVYALYCKDFPESYRYIGKTKFNEPKKRLAKHVLNAERGQKYPVYDWMRKYKGQVIAVCIEANIPENDIDKKEMYYIAKYKSEGHDLLNLTDGGGGIVNPSQATREKMSKSATGKTQSIETRVKISIASKGRVKSEETRKKLSEGRKGKKHSPETKAKISAAGRKRTNSLETREKISEANAGKHHGPNTQEWKDKIAAASTGKPRKPFSDEHRANISKAARNRRKNSSTS
jgi:hypothetical protein